MTSDVSDTILLLAQSVSILSLAAWLTLGLRDNLLYPSLNGSITAEVMAMTRMEREFPAEFQQVAHRAIRNEKTQKLAFRFVLLAELATVILLWLGTTALVLSLFGAASPETARTLALPGALAFTAIWAGFLVVGNHFCYWYCHDGAQNTHYQMTLWGLGTMILLAL